MAQARYSFKEKTDKLNFGFHEGREIGEVIQKDPTYIKWCLENFNGFKLYKKLQIEFDEIYAEWEQRQNESK